MPCIFLTLKEAVVLLLSSINNPLLNAQYAVSIHVFRDLCNLIFSDTGKMNISMCLTDRGHISTVTTFTFM